MISDPFEIYLKSLNTIGYILSTVKGKNQI